jgi:hypothetical protein
VEADCWLTAAGDFCPVLGSLTLFDLVHHLSVALTFDLAASGRVLDVVRVDCIVEVLGLVSRSAFPKGALSRVTLSLPCSRCLLLAMSEVNP